MMNRLELGSTGSWIEDKRKTGVTCRQKATGESQESQIDKHYEA